MEPNSGLNGSSIALLIDFDNVVLGIDEPGFDVELVVNALRERGTIVLGRVYGDWYRHSRHRRTLMEHGLELVETPAFGPVIKNSADIRIALDGFEIGLTQTHIDTFAIVSGDSDFLPLVKKLQALGRRVLVICGNRFTSDMLRRNCNEFISYENLLAQSVGATEDATTIEGAFVLLHRAMAALRERGSEIRGSTLKQMMLQLNPVFSERNFGCNQFRQFLNRAVSQNLVKLGDRDRTSGEFFVMLPDEDEPQPQTTPVSSRSQSSNQAPARRESRRFRRDEVVSDLFPESAPDEIVAIAIEDELAPEIELEIAGETWELPTEFASFSQDDGAFDVAAATEEFAISREELLLRGLNVGKRRYNGKTKSVETSAPKSRFPAPQTPFFEESAPEVEAPEKSKSRSRSRRRRKPENAEIVTTATIETVAPGLDSAENAIEMAQEIVQNSNSTTEISPEVEIEPMTALESESSEAENAAPIEFAPEIAAPVETPIEPAKKPRARAKSRAKKTEAAPVAVAKELAAPEPAAVEAPSVETESETAPAKPARRRATRTRKTPPSE